MATDKIKVAVRVRPFNRREIDLGTQCVVEMDGQQTVLQHPSTLDKLERKHPKTFAFDHCFYSLEPGKANFATQEVVFNCLGRDILENAFQGYNACIFAYGQTGSGKSYTMMGSQDNKGIIPRLCDSLFDLIAKRQSSELSYKVEVSYMEIYNEKVHDLLDPKTNKQSLRVREHNVLGPYVDGLSQLAVTSFRDIDTLMAEGNKSRTVAATNMNSESSRSHAVFTVVLTQTLTDRGSGVTGEKVSRMSLVDLAGSERAIKTGAVGDRLKEGSNINKSLTTLGLVISKLADQSTGHKNKDKFVPYRDSVLTWLLKDNLGGNSKTVMVATLSPAADNYDETLSTLRYADRAKRIVNHAVINEDPNARIIRELRQEVEALKEMLKHATGSPVGENQRVDIHEKLSESEKLMKEMEQTWEEKLVKTERIQNERQQALEKMGISVQASGIKVEKNKYYLVNLNADPSLNELLVYYLKERTLVGSKDADIQLSGLGIQPKHCIIVTESDNGGLILEPLENARSYVNGSLVTERTPLHNGDRILWGNHHFFRVNCPKSISPSEPQTPAQTIDYNFAREELMLNELSNDPIQAAISRLEKQHEEDKQVALEKQRQEYERQFQQLRNILSPSTPYAPYTLPYDPLRFGKITPCTPTTQMRVEKWAQERDKMFKNSLGKLKADIVKANGLVHEANNLAEAIGRQTKFSVTLQIPPANLSPNRKRGAFVSEPAILVKRAGASQVWSMEKLENKLIDMREWYEEHSKDNTKQEDPNTVDPFYESQENHNLIGVANIFLESLFHDVILDYHTPIISQQGEVAGRLQVELRRTAGTFPQDRTCEAGSESSGDSGLEEDASKSGTTKVVCRVSIKQASGLPPTLSNFVFCQYTFWNYPEPIVVPCCEDFTTIRGRHVQTAIGDTRKFEHFREFSVPISEEFLEHCAEGALSIEVWGNRSVGFSSPKPGWEVERLQLAKARSLADRWSELTRKIELWVEIQELNEQGEYTPVEVCAKQDVMTGGVYQLRQGQQRRIQVRVKPVQNSGTLPIICESILNVAVGSVSMRYRMQKPLDSYQEEDLAILRDKWSDALLRRRKYLDQQIKQLIDKKDKTEQDKEREQSLFSQWASLTEERNAVLVPAPGSGIPGAPAIWDPPLGMEPYVPVLFLDLNADDLSTNPAGEEVSVSGVNSILPKEHGNKFYSLHVIHRAENDVCAIASWDSSIHDNAHLNRITDPNERVYLILKTTVRLSHPAPMDLLLRKRLSLNIYKRQSIADRIKRKIVKSDFVTQTGVTYEVVSNIPKASEELEDRESLAQIAASGENIAPNDGETYIEQYTRGVSAVESILTLDRLRQNVAVKELLQAQGQPLMRKTVSVPNFSQIMRFDTSADSLTNIARSESVADLNAEQGHLSRSSIAETDAIIPPKPFGIASPAGVKMGLRMTTLHEEQTNAVHPVDFTSEREIGEDKPMYEDSYSEPECSEFESYQGQTTESKRIVKMNMSSSRTVDSFLELNRTSSKNNGGVTPSASSSSSGYGSQAVSSSNLSSEDSVSVRSISVDETPLMELKPVIEPITDCLVEEQAVPKNSIPESNNNEAIAKASSDEIFETFETIKTIDIIETIEKETQSDITKSEVAKRQDEPEMNAEPERRNECEDNDLKYELETGTSVVKTQLPPGKVVRRRKTSNGKSAAAMQSQRASFPQSNSQIMDGKGRRNDQIPMNMSSSHNGEFDSSGERLDDGDNVENFGSRPDLRRATDTPPPEWVTVGESVLIRPYNSPGVVAYIGGTEFALGTWVGVELDAPTGKNDGTVQGVRYFTCRPKHGIFVRADKLIQDRKGRAMRSYKAESSSSNVMKRSSSRGDGLQTMHRSRSRGESLNIIGTRSHSLYPK